MNEAFKPNPGLVEPVGPSRPDEPMATPAPPARRRGKWIGRGVGLLVVLGAAALVWHRIETPTSPRGQFGPGQRDAAPQTVRVAPITQGDMPITIDALGTVTPLATVTVRTQIAGKLMERRLHGGPDRQERRFPRPDRPAALSGRARSGAGATRQGQAALGQAQADLARYQTLNKQDSIAKQQVEDQRFLVAQDKAAIAVDQAQIDTAKLNIDYTHIVSPINGPRRPAARRSRQLRAADRHDRHRRHHRDRPDQRHLPDAGGQSASHQPRVSTPARSCR